jgi:hypothetical protein
MTQPLVVVQSDDADGPGLPGELLERRHWASVVLRPGDATPAVGEVRGNAIVGGRAPAGARDMAAWLRSCRDAGVLILATGEGTQALADAEPPPVPAPSMVRVDVSQAGDDDPLLGEVPQRLRVAGDRAALPSPGDGTSVVITDADGHRVGPHRGVLVPHAARVLSPGTGPGRASARTGGHDHRRSPVPRPHRLHTAWPVGGRGHSPRRGRDPSGATGASTGPRSRPLAQPASPWLT